MNKRPESLMTRELAKPSRAERDRWTTTADADANSPRISLCRVKRLADCLQRELARGIARHFMELTGLELQLQHAAGSVPCCPDATRLWVENDSRPQRCAVCAEKIWQPAWRDNVDSRVFHGACGRQNCWLRINAVDGCALSLVIQSPRPQREVRQFSTEATDPLAKPDDAFARAVTLLKLVARGMESAIEADELRWTLDATRRVLQAVLAYDTRLQQVLRKFLPEIPGGTASPEDRSHASRLVDQVRDFLLQNYQDPLIGLAEAARVVRRSPSHVSMLFARETGVTFHCYLQELRLTRAKELLRDPRLTVDEVAQACGYSSAGWFRHSFKHLVGLSPSDWRHARLHA